MEDKNSIDIIEKRQQEITFDKIDKLDDNDIEFFSKNVPLLPERDGNRNDLASILVSNYSIKKNKKIEPVACFQIVDLMHVFFYEELRKRILSIDLSSLKEDSDWKKIFRAMKMALINPQFKVGDILYEGIVNRIKTFRSKFLKIEESDSIFRFFEIFSFLLTDYESGRVMLEENKEGELYHKYEKDDDYNIKNAICKLEQNEKEIFDQFRSAVLYWKYFNNKAGLDCYIGNLVTKIDYENKNGNIYDVYLYNDTFCSIRYSGHAFFIQKYNKQYYVSDLRKEEIMLYDDFIKDKEKSKVTRKMAENALGLIEEYNEKYGIERKDKKLVIDNFDDFLDKEDFHLMKKYEGNSNEIMEKEKNEIKIENNKDDNSDYNEEIIYHNDSSYEAQEYETNNLNQKNIQKITNQNSNKEQTGTDIYKQYNLFTFEYHGNINGIMTCYKEGKKKIPLNSKNKKTTEKEEIEIEFIIQQDKLSLDVEKMMKKGRKRKEEAIEYTKKKYTKQELDNMLNEPTTLCSRLSSCLGRN